MTWFQMGYPINVIYPSRLELDILRENWIGRSPILTMLPRTRLRMCVSYFFCLREKLILMKKLTNDAGNST